MIELEKGSDAEICFRMGKMTYEEACREFPDRPDLLTQYRRVRLGWVDRITEAAAGLRTKVKPRSNSKDVREMTIRELCALADEVRSSPAGSRKMRRAADRMAMAGWYLSDSGALQQMLWWERIEPEAPPDAKAALVVMPPR
jgi:hypothetical protein